MASKKQRPGPTDEERAAIKQDFELGELIHGLRTRAALTEAWRSNDVGNPRLRR